MNAIDVMGISKSYGKTTALRRVSFEVEEGDAVAFIGPNGAGKTTLLRILATLTKPDGGHAKVMGLDGRYEASKIRRLLGYMPDAFGMYDDLSVTEYLEFFAGIYKIHGEQRSARVRDLIDLLELDEIRDRATSALSRGMQQRVGLARTLIHGPPILLLDEPAANLDPRSRIEIREMLQELRRMGKTIIISSHILMELDELCNKLLVIDAGRILFQGAVSEVARQLQPYKEIALKVGEGREEFAKVLAAEADVEAVTDRGDELRVRLKQGVEDHSFLVRRAVEQEVPLLGLRVEEPRLEDVFLGLTGEQDGE